MNKSGAIYLSQEADIEFCVFKKYVQLRKFFLLKFWFYHEKVIL